MNEKRGSDDHWRWPEHGLTPDDLRKELRERKVLVGDQLGSPYTSDPPAFCFPGTPIWRAELGFSGVRLIEAHINNIGTHTQETRKGEGGFEDLHSVEAQAVWMAASIIGGDKDTVDGYFCGGATEANIAGLWIGREWLRHHPDPARLGTVVLCTPLSHSSIYKATALLDIGQASPRNALCSRCHLEHLFVPDSTGRGITLVGMNERWEMDLGELDRIFRLRYEEGFRRFIIVPTVGTTAMGSVDPVSEIGEFVRRKHRETLARCYIHVDAAFGGFTVPFIQPDRNIGFDVPEVMSVAMDGDKMGQLPYPSGIFLCRKDLQDLIVRLVEYIGGHRDDTVCGSRPAFPALLAWYQFRADGRVHQRAYVHACLSARNHLVTLIQNDLPWARIHRYSEAVNILPVEFPISIKAGDVGDVPKSIAEKPGILAPYQLRADYVPSNPKDPESCPRIVYKICVMPHTFRKADGTEDYTHLAKFVETLRHAKEAWEQEAAKK